MCLAISLTCRKRTAISQSGESSTLSSEPGLEGKTAYREALDKWGEGINHLAFTVDNLEAETATLAANGVKVLLCGTYKTARSFAYFDTREVGNMMVKLIQT